MILTDGFFLPWIQNGGELGGQRRRAIDANSFGDSSKRFKFVLGGGLDRGR